MTTSSPDTPHTPPVEPQPAGLVADVPPVEPPSDLDTSSLDSTTGELPSDLDTTTSGVEKNKLEVPWWLVVACVFLVGLAQAF